MKFILFILASGTIFFLLGCTQEIHQQDVVGKYRATLPDGAVEFLELRLKDECIQEIHLRNKLPLTAHGKWRYDQKLKCLYLEGTRYVLTVDEKINSNIEHENIPSGNTGALSVSRSALGTVTITLSESVSYKKL